jgi:hypothetical protein
VPAPDVHHLTDDELHDLQLALQLGCGRSKQMLAKTRRQWYCFLFQVLKVEADLRGLPSPTAPFHSSQLRGEPPAI